MPEENQTIFVPPVSTPEAVALALFQAIVRTENKVFHHGSSVNADRKWILDTYAECLNVVRLPGQRHP